MKEKLELIYKIQLDTNDVIFPEWKKELGRSNWQSAILVEVGEAMESVPYKWWKKGERDVENIKMELTDILHFKMSELYYSTEKERKKEFDDFVYGLQVPVKEKEIDLLLSLGKNQTLFDFAKCLTFYGMDIDEVFKLYMTKNVLNIFRLKHGYKEGTYVKIWNGAEDNEVATILASDLEINKEFRKLLYNRLEEEYSNA